MERITRRRLQDCIATVNDVAGFKGQRLWNTDANGNNVATVGMYYVAGEYGGVALYRMSNENGGVSAVYRGSTREVFEYIRARLQGAFS